VRTKIRELHAREIVRCAKRQKITLTRESTGKLGLQERNLCAVATINNEVFGQPFSHFDNAQQNVADHFGVTLDDIRALEVGFEGWNLDCHAPFKENPYYKVGQNVAKLAGLG
jgi:hypothetical protein